MKDGTRLSEGAIAGFLATIPMTLAMEYMFRKLPKKEQYPLPPREITMDLAQKARVKDAMSENEKLGATWAGHFGYGTFVGAIFGILFGRRKSAMVSKGAGFGFLVWLASYMGWLPAAKVLKPATQIPARRNALMIASHLVWGSAAGFVLRSLRGKSR